MGRPDDGGVDIIYIDADDKQWLVQVKRRENPRSTESVSTIRNLLGAMLLQDSRTGIIVSTADHFSYQAYAAVDRAREVGMALRLIDRYALDHMLDGVLQDQPWSSALGQYFPTQLRVLNQRMPDRKKRQTSDMYQLRLFKDS